MVLDKMIFNGFLVIFILAFKSFSSGTENFPESNYMLF